MPIGPILHLEMRLRLFPSAAIYGPGAGGQRTGDGYSSLVISNLPSTATLRVKITLTNNLAAERWVVDNFSITGVTTKT